MKRILLLFVLLIFLYGCGETQELNAVSNYTAVPQSSLNETSVNDTEPKVHSNETNQTRPTRNFTKLPKDQKEVFFQTSDGLMINGMLYDSDSKKTVLLLHMLGRDKSTWEEFAEELQGEYRLLAIDLRGHGASQMSWRNFDDEDFNNMLFDLKAARKFLDTDNFVIIGASIGANVAVKYAAQNDVRGIVLLSPGLQYRGVNIEESITKVDEPVLAIAGEGDKYSADSVETLKLYNDGVETILYDSDEHGTNLLYKFEINNEIETFLETVFNG